MVIFFFFPVESTPREGDGRSSSFLWPLPYAIRRCPGAIPVLSIESEVYPPRDLCGPP